MWLRLTALVLLPEPSPKAQSVLVIVPVDVFVKLTFSGLVPPVGPPTKFAIGTTAPIPVIGFVLLPPFAEENMTTLLKNAALVGLKRTTTFVKPNPVRLNGVPDRIVNGPPVMEVVPPLKAAPPRFVTVKLA